MRKICLVLAVFFSACTTTQKTPELIRKPLTFSLGEVLWTVHNQTKANTFFADNLRFRVQSSLIESPTVEAKTIKFLNETQIQILSSHAHSDLISTLVSEALSEREGVAFVGIKVNDLATLKDILKQRQIPFSEVQWGNTQALFFPEFLRLKTFYFFQAPEPKIMTMETHPNSAEGLEEAWIAVDDFYALENDFAAFGFPESQPTLLQPFRATAKSIVFQSGSLHFVQREHLEENDKQFLRGDTNTVLGVSIKVSSIETTSKLLTGKHRVDHATTRYNQKSCILIPAKNSLGSWLELARPMN